MFKTTCRQRLQDTLNNNYPRIPYFPDSDSAADRKTANVLYCLLVIELLTTCF